MVLSGASSSSFKSKEVNHVWKIPDQHLKELTGLQLDSEPSVSWAHSQDSGGSILTAEHLFGDQQEIFLSGR